MTEDVKPADFPKNWRDMLGEQREWDRLHGEIAHLRSERQELSRALIALLQNEEDISLTREEILALIGKEKPLREFLKEMRGQLVGD